VGEDYQKQRYRLGEAIVSELLPELRLQLDDVMPW
jgi:Uma2 family endonuclease